MSEHEWQEEAIEEVAGEAIEEVVEEEAAEELYGAPDVAPSIYFCNVCEQHVLADELRWSRDGEGRCPVCDQSLGLA